MSTVQQYVQADDQGTFRVGAAGVMLEGIVCAFQKGSLPESIQEQFPSLTLDEVHGAIAYYLENQAEIRAYLQRQEDLWESARAENDKRADPVRDRLRQIAQVQRSQEPFELDVVRNVRWIQASHGLARVSPLMVPLVQGLGRLDSQLIAENRRCLRLSAEERDSILEALRLANQSAQAYLWGLGTYELVRTLDQRCREAPGILPDRQAESVHCLKKSLERIRAPLAKMGPANGHKETDFGLAYPAWDPQSGTGWVVADAFISRSELSDEFLRVVEQVGGGEVTKP